MTRGAAFFAALLVSIGRPAWWLMALATFLLRGGIVVVLLPIVTVPSPLAISNAFAPILLPLALGRVEPAIVAGPVIVVAALLVWLVGAAGSPPRSTWHSSGTLPRPRSRRASPGGADARTQRTPTGPCCRRRGAPRPVSPGGCSRCA